MKEKKNGKNIEDSSTEGAHPIRDSKLELFEVRNEIHLSDRENNGGNEGFFSRTVHGSVRMNQ